MYNHVLIQGPQCNWTFYNVSADLAVFYVMDWNEHNIGYILFSSLSSPSACASPSDPTLTVENVMEVMEKVERWEGTGQKYRLRRTDSGVHISDLNDVTLGVPFPKAEAIRYQSSSTRDRCLTIIEHWISTHPDASWKNLATTLHKKKEERALAVMKLKQYFPKGMCTSLWMPCICHMLWSFTSQYVLCLENEGGTLWK